MDQATKQKIINNARKFLDAGWHCSEGILKVVGEYYFPEQLPALLKITAPFSGGVGGTEKGMCGALSGGLMVIGVLHGRENVETNDDHCLALSAEFREKFYQHFGYVICKELREHWVGQPGQQDCAELTAQAAGLLVDILEK